MRSPLTVATAGSGVAVGGAGVAVGTVGVAVVPGAKGVLQAASSAAVQQIAATAGTRAPRRIGDACNALLDGWWVAVVPERFPAVNMANIRIIIPVVGGQVPPRRAAVAQNGAIRAVHDAAHKRHITHLSQGA
jgi:hypothetical protein